MSRRADDRPAVRRHHRRRHGAGVVHAAGAARQARRGRGAPAGRTRWAWTRRWSCTPRRWARTSPSSSSTARSTTSSTCRKVEVVERDYPLLTPKEVNAAIKQRLRRKLVVVGACIGTDAHTVGIDAILNIKGFAGEKGLEYYRELQVVNLGAQVVGAASWSSGPGRRRPTRSWSPRWSPSATRTCTTPRRCRRRSARPTRRDQRPLLVVGGPRFDETMAAELGVDRIFGRGTTPGEVASYLVHAAASPRPAAGREASRMSRPARRAHASPTAATCRTRHAHYAGNLVDGAYALACSATSRPRCASAPTATRACSRRTPTCSSGRPVRAGDVLEVDREVVRVGTRSRTLDFAATVVARGRPDRSESAAEVLAEPVVATTAHGRRGGAARPERRGVSCDRRHGVSQHDTPQLRKRCMNSR